MRGTDAQSWNKSKGFSSFFQRPDVEWAPELAKCPGGAIGNEPIVWPSFGDHLARKLTEK